MDPKVFQRLEYESVGGACSGEFGDDDLDLDRETVLKVGKSMLQDIDDRINQEFQFSSVGITAQSGNDELGRRRFRTIPEE
jgi:hypothetical protein